MSNAKAFGMEEFLEKCSLISQAIVEKPQGNPCLPEDSCPLGSHRTFLLVWFVLTSSFIERIQ